MGRLSTRLSLLAAAALAVMLSGCGQIVPPHLLPLPPEAKARLQEKGMTESAPIMVRIFKEESELEVWKQKDDGRFHHFKTYPICNWSGELGPKKRQGDKQAPEGFYRVSQRLMNPNSSFHLAFNLGYPNAYDRAHGRTGNFLMVHGDCRSAGCYAMTDALIEEIYALAREAFEGGQEAFLVQAFPFRMTDENMARHANHPAYPFWKTLKVGYDHFEYSRQEPKIAVCNRQYLVNVSFVGTSRVDPEGPCPMYEHLPLEKAPDPPMIQEVKNQPAPRKKLPPHMAFGPAPEEPIASAKPQPDAGDITGSTAASQATIGNGSTFGFAPLLPSWSSYSFRTNSTLGK